MHLIEQPRRAAGEVQAALDGERDLEHRRTDRWAPYPIEQPRRAAGQVEAALDGKGHLEDGGAAGPECMGANEGRSDQWDVQKLVGGEMTILPLIF